MKKIKKYDIVETTIILIIWLSTIGMVLGVSVIQSSNGESSENYNKSFENYYKYQPIPTESPKIFLLEDATMMDFLKQHSRHVSIEIIKHIDIETEYIGEYFVTAYCPEECGGSWSTSSGATCHYSDDPLEPTTCAIDRNYHGYGEYLMIDGKIYVTEDTGPGVKGRWVDCFVETMDEVNSWDTGWKSVYSVTFVEWEEMVVTYN